MVSNRLFIGGTYPSKIVCIGRNYADHISELKNVRPKQPFFFLKPTSSVTLCKTPKSKVAVARPRGVSLHYEVELGVVMGKDLGPNNQKDEISVMKSIKGYAVCIDMTARNVQDEAKKKGLPWTIAKGFDTFLPISQFILKKKIQDPHNAQLWLSVNDEMRQNDSTELMLFPIPRLLSDISNVMTLRKGDIVLTGTPKGVGSVEVGDIMRAGIKIGGKELIEGNIIANVIHGKGPYEFTET